MYASGDLVIYARIGVCRIEGICQEGGREFYSMSSLLQNLRILAPLNSKDIYRTIISRKEAETLIDSIPDIQAAPIVSKIQRELTTRYQAAINSHNCRELLKLTMSIYAKKLEFLQEKKRLCAVDEKYLREGEYLLFGELGIALGIEPKAVPHYIGERLKTRGSV